VQLRHAFAERSGADKVGATVAPGVNFDDTRVTRLGWLLTVLPGGREVRTLRRIARGGRATRATGAVLPEFGIVAIGLIAVPPHQAAGSGSVARALAQVPWVVSGYLITLVVLIVFGIWGFRLASQDNGGNGRGGGRGRPEVEPPPAPGGRQADDQRDAADLDLDREEPEKVPAGVP
jgi:hypothetical protein